MQKGNLIRRAPLVLSLFVLCSCIESKAPLFPNDGWKKASPINSGYYVMRTDRRQNGIERAKPEENPVIVQKKNGAYRVVGDSQLKDAGYAEFFSKYKNGKYIAQAHGKSDAYQYAEVLTKTPNRFIVIINDCGEMDDGLRQAMQHEGWLTRAGRTCYFSETSKLVAALGLEKDEWPSLSIESFYQLTAPPLKGRDLKSPLLFEVSESCQDMPPIVLGPAFPDAPPHGRGKHLRLISKTARSDATNETALAVEADGDTLQNYAWVMGWSDSEKYQNGPLGCSPYLLVKIMAFKPDSNVFDQNRLEPDSKNVRERCAKENAESECGTIDEVISAHQAKGMRILLQGVQMLHFPDDTFADGGLITIMGNEGDSDRMVALVTYLGRTGGRGVTRVLFSTE